MNTLGYTFLTVLIDTQKDTMARMDSYMAQCLSFNYNPLDGPPDDQEQASKLTRRSISTYIRYQYLSRCPVTAYDSTPRIHAYNSTPCNKHMYNSYAQSPNSSGMSGSPGMTVIVAESTPGASSETGMFRVSAPGVACSMSMVPRGSTSACSSNGNSSKGGTWDHIRLGVHIPDITLSSEHIRLHTSLTLIQQGQIASIALTRSKSCSTEWSQYPIASLASKKKQFAALIYILQTTQLSRKFDESITDMHSSGQLPQMDSSNTSHLAQSRVVQCQAMNHLQQKNLCRLVMLFMTANVFAGMASTNSMCFACNMAAWEPQTPGAQTMCISQRMTRKGRQTSATGGRGSKMTGTGRKTDGNPRRERRWNISAAINSFICEQTLPRNLHVQCTLASILNKLLAEMNGQSVQMRFPKRMCIT